MPSGTHPSLAHQSISVLKQNAPEAGVKCFLDHSR